MLAGPHRGDGAGHRRRLAAPEPGAERHRVAADGAAAGLDAANAAALGEDAGDGSLLEDLRPPRPRTLDQRRAKVRGADPAVARRPDGADDVVGAHQRPALGGLLGTDPFGGDAEHMRQRFLAADMGDPVGVGGDRERALVDPTGLLPGLGLELRVERGRVLRQLGHVARRAQGPHLRGRMPGGAGGELVLLDQHCVGDAVLG